MMSIILGMVSQNDDALLEGISCCPGILNDTGLYFALPQIQRLSFDDQIQNFNKTKEAIKAKIWGEAGPKNCPLGCIPSQRVKSKTGKCLKRVNEWVLEFNSKVQKLIATLNRRLPKAKLSFADTYGDVFDLINNPTA
ncbi:hypothetical protein CerSpe_237630 [Prunus speciosa]